MSDSVLTTIPWPSEIQETFPSDELLQGVFEASLSGIALYKPIRAAEGGEIIDFSIELLNAAAQRILHLPARPSETYLQLFPHTRPTGVFDFHCRAFESGQPARYEINYQADGLDNYFLLSARRVGGGLLVSFTDTADHDRSAVEQALRESQAREQEARADAEVQRNQLHNLFMQAPALITIFEGPEHRFKLVNPGYQQLVGPRPLLGKTIREAMPELSGQPIFDLLDKVYRTGEPYFATEMLVQLDHTNSGTLGLNYYNFIYQPTYSQAGDIDGIVVFAYEVTEQVLARRRIEEKEQEVRTVNLQLEAANEELAVINEELQAANEEILANNDELYHTQQALQQLNYELEARVTSRTQELGDARAEAERQRARLERFFMQAPAPICVLDGPNMMFELVNPGYQQLFADRQLLGKPMAEALPELASQSVWTTLHRVYHTGEPYHGREVLISLARQPDGLLEDRYFNFVYQARYDGHGQIDGIMVFAYEVTEQVLARQKVAEANDSLTAANQRLMRINLDLDNFVYSASHDLKQPIHNMAGVFEELKRSATFHDPDAPQLLQMFEAALHQINNTIQGMADAVQIERQSQYSPAEVVTLEPLVQGVIQSMYNQVTQLNAEFKLDFSAVPKVRFARLGLQSVLYNLLSNALKYAHPERPPVVRVATETGPDGAPALVVQDNGLGLDMERYGNDLFQMFRRFHDHVAGSGMGLYLVNRVVQQSGGRIEVVSAVNKGTTFRIYLPGSAV